MLAEQTLYRTRPDVSIDGKRFVYSSTRGAADQFSNLYVQPTAGGEPYKLTFFAHDAFHPRWSPDGEWIAYISNEGGLPQLALLETYGGATPHGARSPSAAGSGRWACCRCAPWIATTSAAGASRIHLLASDGKFYAPPTPTRASSGCGDRMFHHRGEFQVELPGRARSSLEAVKGFEYWPEKLEVEIRPARRAG